MSKVYALLVSALLLSGCASALGDAQQRVRVETPGANDAVCVLDNGDTKYRVWAPGEVLLSKRPADLIVSCVADGNRRKVVTIDPGHTATALGNAVTGFIPGLYVDYKTGALFEYPNLITVDFTDIPAVAMELPNYEKHLRDHPELFGMEEFRSRRSALIRDKYERDFVMEKREFSQGGEFSEFSTIMESDLETEPGGESEAGSEPVATAPTASGSSALISSGPSDSVDVGADMVSDLTKQMNPQVFGPKSSGFVGGTTGPADNGGAGSTAAPTPLQPAPGQ